MSAAKVRSIVVGDGIHLACLDSGPPTPTPSAYTTVVILHGLGWSAGPSSVRSTHPSAPAHHLVYLDIFRKAIDGAPSHGLRVIAVDRRHYGKSTPFTEAELAPLKADDALETGAIEPFMDQRAVEIAKFIKALVETDSLPKPDGQQGGMVLIGWSIGNVFGLDFLARSARLPCELRAILGTYVRGYVIYGEHRCAYHTKRDTQFNLSDPPLDALKVPTPHPEGGSYVQTIIRRSIASGTSPIDAVNDWLTGWCEYTHPDSHDLAERYDRFNEGPCSRPSLWRRASDGPAFQACNEFDRATTDTIVYRALLLASYKTALPKLLYEDPASTLWPGMKIEYVYCANSLWNCIYGADTVLERFEAVMPGRKMICMPQADHFVSGFPTGRVL
jgi:pimeloyl-ACP methyl ester carboxylesterase